MFHYADINTSIELTWWMKHQKTITSWLVMLDKKATTYYSKPVIEICLQHWFPLSKKKTPIDCPRP
jgi:hypothetical protein